MERSSFTHCAMEDEPHLLTDWDLLHQLPVSHCELVCGCEAYHRTGIPSFATALALPRLRHRGAMSPRDLK
jgi:hypothetical protein